MMGVVAVPQQSAFSPAGTEAEAIATLTWIMFGGAAVIFLGVFVLVILAQFGREDFRRRLATQNFILVGGIIFPAVTLTALLIYGLVLTGAGVAATAEDALKIEVTGEQWWWRVRYSATADAPQLETANEIRIPVGREVEITLVSVDVIHSFWVPNLAGKVDMIPGVVNRIRIQATKEGIFRGQCAEFCGSAHAQMAFYVVAMAPAQFEDWLAKERQPVSAQITPMDGQGERVFLMAGCGACHTILGTLAAGTIGPDLTHVGGRLSLAAGTLPNNATSFARWIRDNQHLKPGNRMPPFGTLSDDDLAALGAYLEDLK